jgi:hypothetical protein
LERTVVGRILFAADQQLGVEQLAVGAGSDLVDGLCQSAIRRIQFPKSIAYRWVQVDENGARDVFAAACLGEEGLERATLREIRRIGIGTAVGLQAMLEQVQLPSAVTQLRSRLSDMSFIVLATVGGWIATCNAQMADLRSSLLAYVQR